MFFNYEGNSLQSGIYEIRNRLSNKSYIGSAKEFKARWNGHVSSLKSCKHQNKHLQHSFNYFNQLNNDNFLEFHIVELMPNSTKTERLEREEFWINFAQENNISIYNNQLQPTKEPKNRTTFSLTPEETRKKISEAAKKLWLDPKFKKKHIGKRRTEETKKKMSAAHKGVLKSEEHKKSLRENAKINPNYGMKGKHHTEEERQNIRKRFLGKNNPNFGKHLSDETKRKLSDANKGEKNPNFGKFGMNHSRAKVLDLLNNPLISPQNEVIIKIECLKEFCRKQNVAYSSLRAVIKGKRNSHRGWRLKNTTRFNKTKYFTLN